MHMHAAEVRVPQTACSFLHCTCQFRRFRAMFVACPKGRGHVPALAVARGMRVVKRPVEGPGDAARRPAASPALRQPDPAGPALRWHRARPRRRHQAPGLGQILLICS